MSTLMDVCMHMQTTTEHIFFKMQSTGCLNADVNSQSLYRGGSSCKNKTLCKMFPSNCSVLDKAQMI